MTETTAWLIGVGIVAMALFPFALPGIALTLAALIPLLALAAAGALVAAIVALPVLVLRSLGRRAAGVPRTGTPPARVVRSS